MSDVQPSDAAVRAAARALCAYRSVDWGDLSPDDREGALCEAEAALAAGLAVEYAALADKIETWSAIKAGSGPAYTDGLCDAARIVRAAAGGTPEGVGGGTLPRCAKSHSRYGRCCEPIGHAPPHRADVGADGPDDPGYAWGVPALPGSAGGTPNA